MDKNFLRIMAFACIVLFPSILSAQSIDADEKIYDLVEWEQLNGMAQVRKWKNSLENHILTNSKNCKLFETKVFQSARYYKLECKSQSMSHLINFQNINLDLRKLWRLKKTHTFGNKNYIEFQFLESSSSTSASSSEILFPESKMETNKELKSSNIENPNLRYFIETALYNTNNYNASPNIPIFFDHSCPLVYLGVNHDFYWDDRIYHDFTISCISKSRVSILRLEGSKLGEIQIGNVIRKEIKIGEQFLASILLKNWQDDRILWGEFKLYPYEKK